MKILVEIHHGLGDVVQMIPLFQKLREAYPGAGISAIVASEEHAQILKLTNLVNEFYYLKVREMNLYQQLKFIVKLRKERFDIGIVVPMTTEKLGRILMKSIGCKKIVAPIKNEAYRQNTSVMQGLSLLMQLGIEAEKMDPKIQLSESVDSLAESFLREAYGSAKNKIIGICIGTGLVVRGRGKRRESVNAKGIDLGITIDVSNRLRENGYNIMLLGGKAEQDLLNQYNYGSLTGIVSFAGQTSILQTIALMNRCELVIGGDTGLIHLADAIGIRTLVYYGATGPTMFGPSSEITTAVTANLDCQYCYGTDILFTCSDRKCLKYITAERIYDNARRILDGSYNGNYSHEN
jgi:ADP-heptose:LPS heptosyltransferase